MKLLEKNHYFRFSLIHPSSPRGILRKVLRLCPICEKGIDVDHFINNDNNGKFNYIELCKLWENKRIAIPCCGCYKILKKIKSTSVKITEEMLLIIPKPIVKNLKKFGII